MLNMDFSQRVVINTHRQEWQESPHKGIWYKPLASEDTERGHDTSIVRLEAGASFVVQKHSLGEEVLVIEGTFSDQSGDFPVGSYIRNPGAFVYNHYSKDGCVLLLKLNQFRSKDNQLINVDTNNMDWLPGNGNLKVMPLHSFCGESTALVHWPAGEHFLPHHHNGGEEIFVIRGVFIDQHGRYPEGSWIRSPHMSKHDPYVEEDTLILVKVGHLL